MLPIDLTRRILKFFVFIVVFVVGVDAYGSHAMGADITYKCLGNDRYILQLTIYRDCSGIEAPLSADIVITSKKQNYFQEVSLSPKSGTGQEVSPICEGEETRCQDYWSHNPGVQEWVYEAIVGIPSKSDDWVFSYKLCCRNGAIVTIVDPSDQDMYIEATLDNLNFDCNNAPVFTNKPIPIICQGQEFCFNHGAIDEDGDSLVYELITPLVGEGLEVIYFSGFSKDSPISTDFPVEFNQHTGDICMTPSELEVSVLAVKVTEFREGKEIGSVIRDMQIRVIDCTNNNPWVSGINGTVNFETTVCPGQELCFSILSYDLDDDQNVSLSWNNAIDGATFDNGVGKRPTGKFCWTPTIDDARSYPYCFTVTVNDDNCPFNGSQTFSYCIYVSDISLELGPDFMVGCKDEVILKPNITGRKAGIEYIWSTGDDTPTITVGEGEYSLTIKSDGCEMSDEITITAPSKPTADFTGENVCTGEKAFFIDESTGDAKLVKWEWDFGNGDFETRQNPTTGFDAAGTYQVKLTVEDDQGCSHEAIKTIEVASKPNVDFGPLEVCAGTSIKMENHTTISDGEVNSYTWDLESGQSIDGEEPEIQFGGGKEMEVTLTALAGSGCVASKKQNVSILPAPQVEMNGNNVCLGEMSQIKARLSGQSQVITSWQWSIDGDPVAKKDDFAHVFDEAGAYVVRLYMENDIGCSSEYEKILNVWGMPSVNFETYNLCQGDFAEFQNLTNTGSEVMSEWHWSFGDGGGAGDENPKYAYPNAGDYDVTLIGITDKQCADTIEKSITVHPMGLADLTIDNACAGQDLDIQLSLDEGTTLQDIFWSFGDGNVSYEMTPLKSYSDEGQYPVAFQAINQYGCKVQHQENLMIYGMPIADFSYTGLCEGENIEFINESNLGQAQWDASSWSINGEKVGDTRDYYYRFDQSGEQEVTLNVTNHVGCSSEVSKQLQVSPQPDVSFVHNLLCEGGTALLEDQSTMYGGMDFDVTWEIQGYGIFTEPTVELEELEAGFHHFSLIVTGENGCANRKDDVFEVLPAPEVFFETAHSCDRIEDTLMGDVSIAKGAIESMVWMIDGTEVGTEELIYFTFDEPGSRQVVLHAISEEGCPRSYEQTLEIHPSPIAGYELIEEIICDGNCIEPTDLSSIDEGEVVNWDWYIDGTLEASGKDVQFCDLPVGEHQLGLIVESDKGCRHKVETLTDITIKESPIADFEWEDKELNVFDTEVEFTNMSELHETVYWDFGDGMTSDEMDPVHSYQDSGTYEVVLQVRKQNGCTDELRREIRVDPIVFAYIPNAFSPNDDGDNDRFEPVLYGTGPKMEVLIFDRFGGLIFEGDEAHTTWDGRFPQGDVAPVGVYPYVIRMWDFNGKKKEWKGTVTLVR